MFCCVYIQLYFRPRVVCSNRPFGRIRRNHVPGIGFPRSLNLWRHKPVWLVTSQLRLPNLSVVPRV